MYKNTSLNKTSHTVIYIPVSYPFYNLQNITQLHTFGYNTIL